MIHLRVKQAAADVFTKLTNVTQSELGGVRTMPLGVELAAGAAAERSGKIHRAVA